MMCYLVWSPDEIAGLSENWSELLTEVDQRGHVTREIAINQAGLVVYRAPSTAHHRLLFDNQVVDSSRSQDPMLKARFLALWNQAEAGDHRAGERSNSTDTHP